MSADSIAGRRTADLEGQRAQHPDLRPSRRRRQARTLVRDKWVLRGIVYGSILIAWQFTAMWKGPFFLPTVPDILLGVAKVFTEGYYLTLLKTLQQLLVGFALACAISIPLGALMGRSRVAEDLLGPYVNALFVTSWESLLPIIIIAFGTEFKYRTAVVVLFAFFFPTMNTAAGVRYVERELTETARAFCTSRRRMLTHIYLPAAAPFVVAGVRLGLGMALKGMIIAELWVTVGTGELLKSLGAFRQLDIFFALALLIVLIGVGASESLKSLERRLRSGAAIAGVV